MFEKVSNIVEHAVGDHLPAFRYSLVFFNSIGHYFNVVKSVGPGFGIPQSVWRDSACLMEHCVASPHALDCVSTDQGYRVAC